MSGNVALHQRPISLRVDPQLFRLHTRWTDEASFDRHAALPATSAFVKRTDHLMYQPFDTTRNSNATCTRGLLKSERRGSALRCRAQGDGDFKKVHPPTAYRLAIMTKHDKQVEQVWTRHSSELAWVKFLPGGSCEIIFVCLCLDVCAGYSCSGCWPG